MTVPEADAADVFARFSGDDWSPLFRWLDAFENYARITDPQASLIPGESGYRLYRIQPSQVSDFSKIVYSMPIIISFDWGHWQEGQALYGASETILESHDCVTLCKLITAICRNDRLNEGALQRSLESGVMIRILHALKKRVMSPGIAREGVTDGEVGPITRNDRVYQD